MAKTIIRSCTCKHDYQDKKYGKGKRVCNVTEQEKSRCTVCGKVE